MMWICDEDGNTTLSVTGLNECDHLITELESHHQDEESNKKGLQRVFRLNLKAVGSMML